MPTETIPIILPATARGWASAIGTSQKDQQIINAVYVVSENRQGGSKAVYAQKRSGSSTSSTIGSTVRILKHFSNGFPNLYATDTEVFSSTTSLGSLAANGPILTTVPLADSIAGGVYIVAFVTTNEGWFLFSDATSTTFPTFSGERTSGSAIIANIASTTGIYKGQAISGTGIPANTRVLSVDSSTQITMDANATSGSGTATTITKEAIALITDADFPSDPNSIVAMDGYFFAGSDSGVLYQSAINNPASWSSSNKFTPDSAGDSIKFLFRVGNKVASAGKNFSIQYFYNNGNSTGTVLSAAENLNILGLQLRTAPIPFGDGMYCIAQPGSPAVGTGAHALYRLTGENAFSPASDNYWSQIISVAGVDYLGSIETKNKSLVALLTGEATFPVYDPSTREFSSYAMADVLTSSFGKRFTKSGVSTIFEWDTGASVTDSLTAITVTAQTQPHTLNGGRPFIIKWIDLIADTEASGTASLYVSRDDYGSWESIGTFDMTAQRKRIYGLGWFQSNAAFKIEHSANTNFRAQALIAEVEKCS